MPPIFRLLGKRRIFDSNVDPVESESSRPRTRAATRKPPVPGYREALAYGRHDDDRDGDYTGGLDNGSEASETPTNPPSTAPKASENPIRRSTRLTKPSKTPANGSTSTPEASKTPTNASSDTQKTSETPVTDSVSTSEASETPADASSGAPKTSETPADVSSSAPETSETPAQSPQKADGQTVDDDERAGIDRNLPPIANIEHAFQDLLSGKAKDAVDSLAAEGGFKVRVATMCSGTDSPIFALDFIKRAFVGLDSGHRSLLDTKHAFSAEVVGWKAAFIRYNMKTTIFRDVRDLAGASRKAYATPIPRKTSHLIKSIADWIVQNDCAWNARRHPTGY